MIRICRWVELGLIPLAVLISIWAYLDPPAFTWMRSYLSIMLGVIMLGMGITLKPSDFKRVLKHPKLLAGGMVCQYLFMPLLGYLAGVIFQLPLELLAGFVLLGACPGGTASNVIAYLARADVGLSVSLTLVSTLAAPILTPWITWFYVHQSVDINVLGLMKETCMIVLLPLLGGLGLRYILKSSVESILGYVPSISVLVIVAVIGCVMGLNADHLKDVSLRVGFAVIFHNGCGLLLGYFAARLLSVESSVHRTLAIEVGMQNSGLAAALARSSAGFGDLAALPGALFSLWHNVSGSLLAGYWSSRDKSSITTPEYEDL